MTLVGLDDRKSAMAMDIVQLQVASPLEQESFSFLNCTELIRPPRLSMEDPSVLVVVKQNSAVHRMFIHGLIGRKDYAIAELSPHSREFKSVADDSNYEMHLCQGRVVAILEEVAPDSSYPISEKLAQKIFEEIFLVDMA